MYQPEPPPTLSVSYWGRDSAETEQAVALAFAEHHAAWHREQLRREDAYALGDLVRDAVLARKTSREAVIALLGHAPPPPPTVSARLRSVLQRATTAVLRFTRWR